jgi:hypothetical protein
VLRHDVVLHFLRWGPFGAHEMHCCMQKYNACFYCNSVAKIYDIDECKFVEGALGGVMCF